MEVQGVYHENICVQSNSLLGQGRYSGIVLPKENIIRLCISLRATICCCTADYGTRVYTTQAHDPHGT